MDEVEVRAEREEVPTSARGRAREEEAIKSSGDCVRKKFGVMSR